VKRRWGLSSLSKWPLSELFWRWRPSSRARSQLKGCVGKIHCSFFDGWIRLEHLFETFFAKLRIGKIIDLKTKLKKKCLTQQDVFSQNFIWQSYDHSRGKGTTVQKLVKTFHNSSNGSNIDRNKACKKFW
jgi:hypothetical protein